MENVGTRSDPLIRVVIKCLPDSAKSHVIQAAAKQYFKQLDIANHAKAELLSFTYGTKRDRKMK